MKKYYVLFFIMSLFPLGIYSQGWLNRTADNYRQRNQQRTTQRNNNQRTYQNYQRNNRQEETYQQRSESQQRNNNQQQNYNPERVVSSNSISSSDINNQVQGNDKVVTLVTSGTGATKEEATKNALRSAIEQAYGTFVSANTQVVNDELLKDEIATVSSGNIQMYEELSSTNTSNGIDVTLKVTVSPEKLVSFAKSKGMKTELAGASFVMNMKMRELNKKNEVAAILHMIKKAGLIAQKGLFDYKLEIIGEPILRKDSKYQIKVKILFCENTNTIEFYKTIYQTLQALSISPKERYEYMNAGLGYYLYDEQFNETEAKWISFSKWNSDHDSLDCSSYALRNTYARLGKYYSCPWIMPILISAALNYEIKDNIGTIITCRSSKIDDIYYKNDSENREMKEKNQLIWYYQELIDKNNQRNGYYYYFYPSNRIEGSGGHSHDWSFLNVPIIDYGNDSRKCHFNPLLKSNPNNPRVRDRINQHIYYQQEFFIVYSENELSKLNSITIEPK